MENLIIFIGAVAVLAISFGLSWLVTCWIIKMITWCFGWTFSLPVATGIWLIMLLMRSVFKSTTTVKK